MNLYKSNFNCVTPSFQSQMVSSICDASRCRESSDAKR